MDVRILTPLSSWFNKDRLDNFSKYLCDETKGEQGANVCDLRLSFVRKQPTSGFAGLTYLSSNKERLMIIIFLGCMSYPWNPDRGIQ